MVISIFNAALVLAIAVFGDLYHVYALDRYLKLAHELLTQFTHDQIAQRESSIVSYLRDACDLYLEKRAAQTLEQSSLTVGSIFAKSIACALEPRLAHTVRLELMLMLQVVLASIPQPDRMEP